MKNMNNGINKNLNEKFLQSFSLLNQLIDNKNSSKVYHPMLENYGEKFKNVNKSNMMKNARE